MCNNSCYTKGFSVFIVEYRGGADAAFCFTSLPLCINQVDFDGGVLQQYFIERKYFEKLTLHENDEKALQQNCTALKQTLD